MRDSVRKMGYLKIEFDRPQTALYAYFEATGVTKSAFAEALDVGNRNNLYDVLNGNSCSREFALAIHKLTGLDRDALVFIDRSKVWHFRLLDGWQVEIMSEQKWGDLFGE